MLEILRLPELEMSERNISMTNEQKRNEQFRAAIEELAGVVRRHPGTGGGQLIMRMLISIAFRLDVPMDLGAVSYHLGGGGSSETLDAVLIAIRYRALCNWPVDILPDEEIQGWIKEWEIAYEAA